MTSPALAECENVNHNAQYATLTAKCKMKDHLREVNLEAHEQIELITAKIARAEGASEDLHASDQLEWIRRMNSSVQERKNRLHAKW